MLDAQAIADDIARQWLREECWRAHRRAQLEAERPPPRPPRPLSSTADELHEALLAVAADTWLPALIDVDVPRSRTIRCPFHADGQERTPSCRIYETSYYCFGCGSGGDVFAFAGELWGIPTRSRSFPELRERLADHLLGMAA
jgi:hypothetical protein